MQERTWWLFPLVLLGISQCIFAVPPGATVRRVFRPGFDSLSNIDTSNGMLRVQFRYGQRPGQGICMEAENATVLRFVTEKAEVATDARASGGAAIAHLQHAEYHFKTVTPGRYRAWYRGSYPWKGNWIHGENMDGGSSRTVQDSDGKIQDSWLWHSGPVYELARGEHSWNLTPFAWMGGARLDKVLLLPEGSQPPTGKGPPASPVLSRATGTAVSETIPGRRAARWESVTCSNLSGEGELRLFASNDGGRHWRALPEGGRLGELQAGKDLRIKVELRASPSASGPILAPVEVTYFSPVADEIVLENEWVQWRFAGENGAIRGIRNKATRTEYMAKNIESPLFAFRVIRGSAGKTRTILFGQADLISVNRPGPGRLILHHRLMGGNLSTTLDIRLGNDRVCRFGLTVRNQSEYAICEVKLPVLLGLRIGSNEKDDFLMQPITTGSIVQYPAQLKFPRLIYTDRPLVWPSMASVCFTDLWDEAGGGLYLACYDKKVHWTELTFAPGDPRGSTAGNSAGATIVVKPGDKYKYADPPGKYIHLGFRKQILIDRSTGKVRLPEVAIGVHEGDWHWGADRYRAWAESWMLKKKKLPDWYRDAEGWIDSHMIHLGAFVDMTKGWARTSRLIPMNQLPLPCVAMWCQQASCEAYWATPVLHYVQGSAEEYAGGIQKQHEMGNRWISYVLPPRINPMFHRGAKRNGCVPIQRIPPDEVPPEGFYREVGARNYNGSLIQPDGVYCEGLVDFGHPKWRYYLRHIVLDKYIRQDGCDGMYLDGVGLASYPRNVRSFGFGYGEWQQAFHLWLEDVRDRARKIRPGAIFAGEGMGDVDHQFLDVGLFGGDNAPYVLRYTIPWAVGTINGPAATNYTEYAPEDYLDFVTVFGLKLGNVGTTLLPAPQRFRRYLHFRRTFTQFQSRARFLDEQGVTWDDKDLQGKLYVRDDRNVKGVLFVAFNKKEKPGLAVDIDQELIGPCNSAWAYTLDTMLHRLSVLERDGRYRVILPVSRLAAVMLFNRAEPFIDIERVAPVVPSESGTVRATVRNLDAQVLRGRFKLELPRGWKSSKARLEIAPGQQQSFNLAFRVSRHEKTDVHDIYATAIERGRVTRKCRPMGVCRPIAAELFWVKPDTVRLVMQNRSTNPVVGTASIQVPPRVEIEGNNVAFEAPARGTSELLFRVKNRDVVKTREHLKAVIKYTQSTSYAYELIQPPLLNGGFEQCVAGDGWPDYWNYRKPEHLTYKGAALDRQVFCEGKQSLRIDPYSGGKNNYLSSTLIQLVPNTRYRVQCSIRRSAHHSGILVYLYPMVTSGKYQPFRIYLGQEKDGRGPVGVWEDFESEFTSLPIKVPYNLILLNHSEGAATAWFDNIRIEPIPSHSSD